MKFKLLITIIFLGIYTSVLPQSNVIDSLILSLQEINDIKKAEVLNQISETYGSNSTKRIEFAGKALSSAKRLDLEKEILRAYGNIGLGYYYKKDYQKSLDYYYKIIDLTYSENYDSLLGLNYHRMGNAFHKLGKNENSLTSFKEAVTLRSIVDDKIGLAYSLNNIGLIYWRLSRYDSAIYYYSKCLSIREELKDSIRIASTFNNIGIIYWQWADYPVALEYYLNSLKIREKLNDQPGVALVLNNIGMVYQKLKDYDKAINHFRDALKISLDIEDIEKCAYSYYNIGTFYNQSENPDSALYYHNLSLVKYKEISNDSGIQLALGGVGETLIKLGKYEKAITELEEAITFGLKASSKEKLAQLYKSLGNAYYRNKNYNKALNRISKSLKISQEIDQRYLTSENYFILSEIYNSMEIYNNAYSYLKKHKSLEDSIFSERTTEQLAQMQTKFEVQKHENENENLKYKNELQSLRQNYILIISILLITLISFFYYYRSSRRKRAHELLITKNLTISKQKDELEELNATKDKLFSIISHDLKNPFLVLQQLTEVLSDKSGLDQDERNKLIKKIEKNAKITYGMLENLLDWASFNLGKITPELKKENLYDIVSKGMEPYQFFAEKKEITIKIEIPKDIVLLLDPQLIKTVIGNVVNNSIKFTNSKGRVTISYSKDEKYNKIVISDNGIGMDQSIRDKLFKIDEKISKKGTDSEKGTGLGLILCKEFIEKVNGKILIESEVNTGTNVTICLPI